MQGLPLVAPDQPTNAEGAGPGGTGSSAFQFGSGKLTMVGHRMEQALLIG